MLVETPIPLPPLKAPNPISALPVISCGFASPAEEFSEPQPSLDSLAILRPAATFLMRAGGDSMIGAGIYAGDVLIVDRSLTASHEDIVVAVIDGEFTCKQLLLNGSSGLLAACNPDYLPIPVNNVGDLIIWGVVTFNLHRLSRTSK